MKHSFMLTIPETKRKISIDTDNIIRFIPSHDEFKQLKKRPDILSVITDAIFNISVDQRYMLSNNASSLLIDLINIEEYITSNNIELSYNGDLSDINHHKLCIALILYNLQSNSIVKSYSDEFKAKLIELEYLKISVSDRYDHYTYYDFITRFTNRSYTDNTLLSTVSDTSILDNLKSKLSYKNKKYLYKFEKKTFQSKRCVYWTPTNAKVIVASVGINNMKSWFNTVEEFKTLPLDVRFELLKLDPEHFYLMYPDKKKVPWKKLSKHVENLHLRIPESTFYLLSR